MDCKRALEETGGDLDKATVAAARARPRGRPRRRPDRDAREGLVGSYIHTGGRIGVLIEVNCETDFVARNEQFQKLVQDLAMQVVGLRAGVRRHRAHPAPTSLEAKRAELLDDALTQKKPEAIRGQIVEGQLEKWYKQVCLLEQPFRDTEIDRAASSSRASIATIGENIRVRRFARYELGEEL